MKRINLISDSDSDSDYESDDAFVKELVSALSNNPDIKNIAVKCNTKKPHSNTKYFTLEEKIQAITRKQNKIVSMRNCYKKNILKILKILENI